MIGDTIENKHVVLHEMLHPAIVIELGDRDVRAISACNNHAAIVSRDDVILCSADFHTELTLVGCASEFGDRLVDVVITGSGTIYLTTWDSAALWSRDVDSNQFHRVPTGLRCHRLGRYGNHAICVLGSTPKEKLVVNWMETGEAVQLPERAQVREVPEFETDGADTAWIVSRFLRPDSCACAVTRSGAITALWGLGAVEGLEMWKRGITKSSVDEYIVVKDVAVSPNGELLLLEATMSVDANGQRMSFAHLVAGAGTSIVSFVCPGEIQSIAMDEMGRMWTAEGRDATRICVYEVGS